MLRKMCGGPIRFALPLKTLAGECGASSVELQCGTNDVVMNPEAIEHVLNLVLVCLQGGSLSGQIDSKSNIGERAEDLSLDSDSETQAEL
jgi:hypothetical protein